MPIVASGRKKRSASLTETLPPDRPKTLKKSREPKYPRVSVAPMQKLDQFQVCAQLIPDDFGIARARTMRVPPARYHRNLLGF